MTARGIRNRNPLNLKDFGIPWRGLVGRDEDGFCVFDTMRNGIRAAALDILNDWQKGKKTIGELLVEFAPKTENDTVGYAEFVARRCQISTDTLIDPFNQTTLINMLSAMIRMETGEDVHFGDIEDGAEDALSYRRRGLATIPHAGKINEGVA